MAKNIRNMLKFVMFKSCKSFHLSLKIFSNVFSNPKGGSLALEAQNILKKLKKKFKTTWKKASFIKKLQKFVTLKSWKTILIKIFE